MVFSLASLWARLADSFGCLKIYTSRDAACSTSFLSLPREIRDLVYANLVVSADPIQYDRDFQTLSRSGTFTNTALALMFPNFSNGQMAREICEMFYGNNTFLVYTHDIAALLDAKVHRMSIKAAESAEPTVHSMDLEAGALVRNLAVRVGWHTSHGWYTGPCCEYPAADLRRLLEWDSLRSVIIDARFGAWPYGEPRMISGVLFADMIEKWGDNFKIYNDQTLSQDTRRYTDDRRDISFRWADYRILVEEVKTAGEESHTDTETDSERGDQSDTIANEDVEEGTNEEWRGAVEASTNTWTDGESGDDLGATAHEEGESDDDGENYEEEENNEGGEYDEEGEWFEEGIFYGQWYEAGYWKENEEGYWRRNEAGEWVKEVGYFEENEQGERVWVKEVEADPYADNEVENGACEEGTTRAEKQGEEEETDDGGGEEDGADAAAAAGSSEESLAVEEDKPPSRVDGTDGAMAWDE